MSDETITEERPAVHTAAPVRITLGNGNRKCTRGTPTAPLATPADLAEAVGSIAPGEDAWWSVHSFKENERSTKAWVASAGIAIDLDWQDRRDPDPNTWHAALPADVALSFDEAVTFNQLPGSIAHRTPRGARVIFMFAEMCSDPRALEAASRVAANRMIDALRGAALPVFAIDAPGVPGFEIDGAVLLDRARLLFAPRAIVGGLARDSVVSVLRPTAYTLAELVGGETPAGRVMVEVRPERVDDGPVAAYVAAHPREYPRQPGTCPACKHNGCFHAHRENPQKWICRSNNHPDGVGVKGNGIHSGDALDLDAFEAGRSPAEHLRAAGAPSRNAAVAVEWATGDSNAPPELVDLNAEFFIIEEGGKHLVACEADDSVRHRRMLKRFTFEEFKKRLGGAVVSDHNRRDHPLAKAWLAWLGRRQYLGGVAFDPTGRERGGVYNLWRGWPIAPQAGDWTILREHIRDVLCAGDSASDTFVMGWLARLVQRPAEPGEVVLLFRGRQGAGKSILGDAVRRMFGQHALPVSSPRAVVGQFNAHLRDLVFLLANEAVFAGDRATTSALKALITDATLPIEQKHVDLIEVPNMLHIMMTTNAEWAAPVALDDRRFATFDVSPHRVGDRAYFDEVAAAVKDGPAIGAMLHGLLHYDLSNFEVRDIPETSARHDQMLHSLEGPEAWLCHALTLGDCGAGVGWRDWVSTRDLQEGHEAWARNGKHRHAADAVALGKCLTRFFRAERPRRENPGRAPGYRLGSLAEARARFRDVTRLPASLFPDDAAE